MHIDMNKQDATKYIFNQLGHLPDIPEFDIYNDDDIIPDNLITHIIVSNDIFNKLHDKMNN